MGTVGTVGTVGTEGTVGIGRAIMHGWEWLVVGGRWSVVVGGRWWLVVSGGWWLWLAMGGHLLYFWVFWMFVLSNRQRRHRNKEIKK